MKDLSEVSFTILASISNSAKSEDRDLKTDVTPSQNFSLDSLFNKPEKITADFFTSLFGK